MTPDISVLTTTYNAERSISNVLRGLTEATEGNAEIVVVDDGSTDNTVAIMRDQHLKSIKLIEAGKVGRGKALNIALRSSTGRVIFINDADDYSSAHRFKRSMQLIDRGAEVVFGNAMAIENIGQYEYPDLIEISQNLPHLGSPSLSEILAKDLYKTNPLHHSTMAAKRACLFNVGGYSEQLSVCLDLDMYYKLMAAGIRITKTGDYFILRNVGDSRHFSKIPSRKYLRTLLHLRRRYRKALAPPPHTYLYDAKYIFNFVFNTL